MNEDNITEETLKKFNKVAQEYKTLFGETSIANSKLLRNIMFITEDKDLMAIVDALKNAINSGKKNP